MRYRALAFDYDGTLAKDGQVADSTVAALERAAESGRRLLLVTGRELDDLSRVFDRLDLFDRVVAENGGLLHRPASREQSPLADPPPAQLVDRLRAAQVQPLGVGAVIIATRQPHDRTVLDAIRDLGLELQVIFNKGAVMVLPSGVNKATGLAAALVELGLSAHNVLGVGDAENDHAFLDACECAVAVGNALPALKERCDIVTEGSRGDGVEEIIGRVVDSDLADLGDGPARHHVLLGHRAGGSGGDEPVRLPPHGVRMVVAGPSGSGKSTVTSAVLERLIDARYQVCLIDPEGDYEDGIGPESAVLGDTDSAPSTDEVVGLLDRPDQSVVVNLLAIPLPDRPGFCTDLLPHVAAHAARTGRPHWLVVDEAHHLLPAGTDTRTAPLFDELGGVMLVTVHPEAIEDDVLSRVDTVAVVGTEPAPVVAAVARHNGAEPDRSAAAPATGQLVLWRTAAGGALDLVDVSPPAAERRRHRRKYAVGTMSRDTSFYFRGPEDRLNLRAHNLTMFLQIGDGVDDDTWLHHLRAGDYSRWMADDVSDTNLAEQVAEVERDHDLTAKESRERIRELVLDRYTQAAEPDPDTSAPS